MMVDYILQEVFDVTIYPIYFVSSSFEKKVKEKWTFKKVKFPKPIFEFPNQSLEQVFFQAIHFCRVAT